MVTKPNIEIQQIVAFTTVAKKLSFRKAAESLNMTQPGLTRIIKKLEDEIGVKLLKRTTRSVELTEAGAIFFNETQNLVEKLGKAISKARNAEAGNIGYLKIAYMGFAINGQLPEILRKFHERFPGIRTDLVYMPTKIQKEKILESEIDIGFLMEDFHSPDVEKIIISKERLVAVLPANHRYRHKSEVTFADLEEEQFILGSPKDWSTFLPMIVNLCQQSNFNPKIRQYVDTSEGIFGMVAAGLGITIYTESAVNVRQTGLIIKPLSNENAVIKIYAVWKKNNPSKSLEKFKNTLVMLA
jgi:DNA-binding transcriptional LysR family regulator